MFLRFEKYIHRIRETYGAFYGIFYYTMKRRAREINLEIIRVMNVSLELILRLLDYKSSIVFLEIKEKYNYLKIQVLIFTVFEI